MTWPFQQWNCLCLLWCRFFPFSTLFWLFLRLRCEMMGPCFIHDYNLTQKVGFIATVKHRQKLDWNILMMLCLFHCEQTRYTYSFLMSKFSVNMRCTAFFEISTMSASLRTFKSTAIQYHFVHFLHRFCCGRLTWSTTVMFFLAARKTSLKLPPNTLLL